MTGLRCCTNFVRVIGFATAHIRNRFELGYIHWFALFDHAGVVVDCRCGTVTSEILETPASCCQASSVGRVSAFGSFDY